jgi:hypothetical protein
VAGGTDRSGDARCGVEQVAAGDAVDADVEGVR